MLFVQESHPFKSFKSFEPFDPFDPFEPFKSSELFIYIGERYATSLTNRGIVPTSLSSGYVGRVVQNATVSLKGWDPYRYFLEGI